jgi:hypothetical protein
MDVTANLTSEGEYVVGMGIDSLTVTMTSKEAERLAYKLLKASGKHFEVLPELQATISDLHQRMHTQGLNEHETVALLLATQQLRGIEALLAMDG